MTEGRVAKGGQGKKVLLAIWLALRPRRFLILNVFLDDSREPWTLG